MHSCGASSYTSVTTTIRMPDSGFASPTHLGTLRQLIQTVPVTQQPNNKLSWREAASSCGMGTPPCAGTPPAMGASPCHRA